MTNYGFASAFCRWALGIFIGMIGYFKVFTMTAYKHAEQFFVTGFQDSWIPEWLLWSLGYTIPYVELIFGGLVFFGIFVRYSTVILGFLLMVVGYGHMLQDAFYDPTSHFMPRFILIIGVLLLYSKEDEWSLEHLYEKFKSR